MRIFCKCGSNGHCLDSLQKHIRDHGYSTRCTQMEDFPFYLRVNRIPYPMENPPTIFHSYILSLDSDPNPLSFFKNFEDVIVKIVERQSKPIRICFTAQLIVSCNSRGYDPPITIISDCVNVENYTNIRDIVEKLYRSLKFNMTDKEILSRSFITVEIVH
jgi:hypothetical protein